MAVNVPLASERLRERASAELGVRLPAALARLDWDRARLAAHQRDRLRELLRHAAANSPFHARRLAGIDVDRFELADLPRLPVMTKAEMMSEFDDVVTDRRLTLARVQAHLEASHTTASALLDDYVCLASGGSSGLRAAFVQTIGEFMDYMAAFIRPGAAAAATRGASTDGVVIGVVASASPMHASGLATSLISSPVRLVSVPAVLPVREIAARLNDLRPPALTGYSTMLALLAAEQRAGRLRIAPASVTASSEMLTGEDAAAITEAFGVPVTNQFSATEGLIGTGRPGEQVQTFATDMCLAEPVNAAGDPVPPGMTADRVLVTNLHNRTQPMIRYELTDRFTRHEDDPAGRLRAVVEGRADSAFRYGDVTVHPITFHSVLTGVPAVTEFQVRQTQQGATIDVVAEGHLYGPALGNAIRDGLARCGLAAPVVAVRVVPRIGRHPQTGKVVRFLPLPELRAS